MGSGSTKLSGATIAETIVQLPDLVDEVTFIKAFSKYGFDSRLFISHADVDGFISKAKIESLAMKRDCYISYDLSCDADNRVTSSRVRAISDYLRSRGLTTWLDQDEEVFSGNDLLTTETRIRKGIRNSQVVIICLTSNYAELCNGSDPYLTPPAPELSITKSDFEKKANIDYNIKAVDNKNNNIRPFPRAVHSIDTNKYFDSSINCKLEFFTALREVGAQMMVPAVMEYRLSQPQSWGSKVYNALGARIRIMMDDFENQQSQLDNLFNLITSRIRPLTKGNDTARNEEIYTQSGKIRSWLKEHTSMTKVERTKYSQIFANDMKIESVASLLRPLQHDSKYLTHSIGLHEKYGAEIYRALHTWTIHTLNPERQFEIPRLLQGESERRRLAFKEEIDETESKLAVVREALNNCAMGEEDRSSRMLRAETKLTDLAATIRLRLENMQDFEERQIAADQAYTDASRIEFDLRVRQTVRLNREKDLLDMLLNVSLLYPASVLVRKVLDRVKHYNYSRGRYIDYGDDYSPPTTEMQNLNISKLDDTDICVDISAAFLMIIRLIRTKADTVDQLLQAGILAPLLALLGQCYKYTQRVDINQYLAAGDSISGHDNEFSAPCCGLTAIRTICRLRRYGDDSVNLSNTRLMTKSGALTLCHDIITYHLNVHADRWSRDSSERIVGFALDCASSLLFSYREYISYSKTIVLPVSTQSSKRNTTTTPSIAVGLDAANDNVELMVITISKAVDSISAFKDSRVVVEYACEIIAKIVSTVNGHHDSPDDAISTTIYRSICCALCDAIDSHYDHPRTLDWLLYSINRTLLCKPNCMSTIIESNIYLHIVTILELHQESMSVLETATFLLGNLIDSGDEDVSTNIQQFYHHDIFSITWRLLKRYHLSAFLVSSNIYYIMWLLFNVDVSDDGYISSIRGLIFDRLISDGFCELLLFTCNTPQVFRINHPSVVDMFSNIARLVNAVLKFGSNSVVERVITIGIPEKLVNVLKKLGDSKSIWQACCIHMDFVGLLNPKYETKSKLYKCGVCEILYYYLKDHLSDEVSVHLFMKALDKLVLEPLISDRFATLNIKGFLLHGTYNGSLIDIQDFMHMPENIHLKIKSIEYESFVTDCLMIHGPSSLRRVHDSNYSATDIKVSRLNLYHHYKLPVSMAQSQLMS